MSVITIVNWCYNITITHLTMEKIMWHSIMNWFEACGRRRAAGIVANTLSLMTDRELKDIGITRGEIREYALTGKRSSDL